MVGQGAVTGTGVNGIGANTNVIDFFELDEELVTTKFRTTKMRQNKSSPNWNRGVDSDVVEVTWVPIPVSTATLCI